MQGSARERWGRRWGTWWGGPSLGRRLGAGLGIALLAGVVAFGVGEALGWPFLAAPMQRALAAALHRTVSLAEDPTTEPKARIHLLGGIDLTVAYLRIGAPDWSTAPHLLVARDAQLTLGYTDLWRAHRGQPLHIRALRAARLDGQLERLADGRASWQFGAKPALHLPTFGRLQVGAGTVAYRDIGTATEIDAQFSLADGADLAGVGAAAPGLQLKASGHYGRLPLLIEVQASSVLPVLADDAVLRPVAVSVDARVGRASVVFKGSATDALHLGALQGQFSLQGPSLAAVGDPFGVTLPTTGPFRSQGRLAKQGAVWNTVVEQMSIGSSHLAGAFTYDPRPNLPLLSGRLTGSRLALADLGPAVGTAVGTTVGTAVKTPAPAGAAKTLRAADAAQTPRAAEASPGTAAATVAKPGRVLPQREFDLPALRAMNANVLVAIDRVELGSGLLEPLLPLRAHLLLADGVLTLRDIDARTGQGRLGGLLQFDGRTALAQWTTDARWADVRLESWIHQARANQAPPWASGRLSGQARLAGQGKSTAAILGSLRGGVRMNLAGGSISHLAVEAAGLDIAQGLGVLIKGDDALKINCTVADFVAEQGVLRPRALVLDTVDSTLWMDGSVSLASEAIDLRMVVAPKDFSPLALRTPIHLRGSLANPSVSIERGKLGARLGASALLALINPLAALIPLIDAGNSADAARGADQCRALAQRIAALPNLPAPAAAASPRLTPSTRGRAAQK